MAEKGTSRKSVGPKPLHRDSQPSVATAERIKAVNSLYDCFWDCSFVRISSRGLITVAEPTDEHRERRENREKKVTTEKGKKSYGRRENEPDNNRTEN